MYSQKIGVQNPFSRRGISHSCHSGSSIFLVYLFMLCFVSALQSCSSFEPATKASSQKNVIKSSGLSAGAGNRSPYVVFGQRYEVLPDSLGYLEIGIASWYGSKFHGRLTSNGETYDMYQLTAAHKALPLPTFVRVTNLDNGKKVILRVNDRGPFHDDRVIDLSYKAALKLGFADKGTAPVVVEAIDARNYPERVEKAEAGRPSYYLQVGAFSHRQGAQSLLLKIQTLLNAETQDIPVRILQSEIQSGILHKVWIGPIATEYVEEQIFALVSQADLGRPIKVEVD